ncbi:Rieske 2Fe-2S domain-containing protein [Collimonas pratensis]|uniref:Rieske (2Fe-2S) protein n=1 Tax=Collimonas pratensis TaxID=279113 RepID=UPI00143D74B0|nr:Rieske 2Fe-2S domain-containing protein [Collimonas pratensis]NKI68574.1 Rieske 2Fe-2S domain-containing protein [Collimonas pratensis]
MSEQAVNNLRIPICASSTLAERGRGVRFPVTAWGDDAVAFVIRYDNVAHAYLNRCAHVAMELDWNEGDFFESSGLYLMCATHGAVYEPETGRCAGGPCRGGRLHKILVEESNDQVFWIPDENVRPVLA